MLEAGSHGVPVVASDLPTLRAIAGDEATFVAPTASGAVLARAVERRLSSDPVARLRRRAKQHAWPRLLREQVLPAILGRAP
jgi:glycosyltransferase involved in cell wall biosynthesis